MRRSTREQAEELKIWLEEHNPGIAFVVQEGLGGIGFDIFAKRTCACGTEYLQGDNWDKPAICEKCARRRKMAALEASDRQQAEAQARLRRHEDFDSFWGD